MVLNRYKPAEFFLVIEETVNNTKVRKALIVSLQDAKAYQQQILTGDLGSGLRQAALFTSNGEIAACGTSKQAYTSDGVKALQSTDWFKKVVNDVGLFSENVRDPKRLNEQFEKNGKEVFKVWKQIRENAIEDYPEQEDRFEKLMSAAGVDVPASPKKEKKEKAIKPLSPAIQAASALPMNEKGEVDYEALGKEVFTELYGMERARPVGQTTASRGQFIKDEMQKFYKENKWMWPLSVATLGSVPAGMAIYYSQQFKNE